MIYLGGQCPYKSIRAFKMDVKEENTYDVLLDAWQLARDHYYEVEEKSDTIPFNLDLGMMEKMLDAGILFIVTARVEGELIGYFANLVSPDVYTGKVVSKELGIYLKPEYRGSTAFPRMLQKAEQGAVDRGAYSQMLAFKKGHDFGLAQRLGYEETETIYHKIMEV